MKKYGAVIALVVAVLSGVLAVYLANSWLDSRPEKEALIIKDSVPTTRIVIASRDCEVGAPLSQENLALADWPKTNIPKGAFEEIDAVKGQVAVTRLKAGQPILAASLAPEGSGAGLVAAIDKGKRAMSIRVDEVVGVGGFILPNTFVDIIAIEENSDQAPKARVLLERIEVLAIAQETYKEDGKPKVVKTVTLQLDPEQAKKLALQTHQGQVQLTLRNPLEGDRPKPQVAQAAPARPEKAPGVPILTPRIRIPKAKSYPVEVIRRSRTTQIEFENVESENKI
jgi:pilus assembly protein CpaB